MIIYSCITNGYDEIPDENYYDPDVKYVMFTDDTVERKGPWEFRPIPCFHPCPRIRSSYVKINPHKVFDEGEEVVWIDGCYIMNKEYVENSKRYFEKDSFTVIRHVNRYSYYDEILEGFMSSMNTKQQQLQITRVLQLMNYDFKKYSSPVLGSIWRRLENYEKFGNLWWNYALIGPNRDQISFDAAKQFTNKKMTFIEDGWHEVWRDKRGKYLHRPGSCGILFGQQGKKYRRKRHPQAGHPTQWKERREILAELREITGLHPFVFAKHDHSEFVERNVISPTLPLQK